MERRNIATLSANQGDRRRDGSWTEEQCGQKSKGKCKSALDRLKKMKKDKERLEKISEDKERKDKEQGKQDEKAKEEKWGKLEGNDWKQN